MRSASIMLAVAAGVSALAGNTHAQVNYETVLFMGQPAPGLPEGVRFSGSYIGGNLLASGEVLLNATLVGPGVNNSNDGTVWVGRPGSLNLVAREGMIAPGTDASMKIVSGRNRGGQLTIHATLDRAIYPIDPGIEPVGDWLYDSGDWRLIYLTGAPVPGIPNATCLQIGGIASALGENIVFFSSLRGEGIDSTNNTAVWVGTPGALQLAFRKGSLAPGLDVNAKYQGFNTFRVNKNGEVSCLAALSDSAHAWGIFAGSPASVKPVFASGDSVPGLDPGMKITIPPMYLSEPNAAGKIMFAALLTDQEPPKPAQTKFGIFYGAPGSVQCVARPGLPAPGTDRRFGPRFLGDGTNSITWQPAYNDRGQVVFAAELVGADPDAWNDVGIWLADMEQVAPGGAASTSLKLIARAGDPAPGLDQGIRFGRLGGMPSVGPDRPPGINNRGQVAFLAYLTGEQVNDSNDASIWVWNPDNTFVLVAREGDLFDVGHGEKRRISSLYNQSDSPTYLTDNGELAFSAQFTDGSLGLFVATIPIPEPASVGTILLASMGLLLRRRCRRS